MMVTLLRVITPPYAIVSRKVGYFTIILAENWTYIYINYHSTGGHCSEYTTLRDYHREFVLSSVDVFDTDMSIMFL